MKMRMEVRTIRNRRRQKKNIWKKKIGKISKRSKKKIRKFILLKRG